jgi:hypothetical protein
MRKYKASILTITMLLVASSCQTLSLYGKTGLIVENRSSFDIRIESLKKITFEDRKTTPKKRSYRYYIHKIDTVTIKSGMSKRFNIADGYYGIEFCDGKICTYTNFSFEKVMLLILEDATDKRRTMYRFVY